VSNTLLDNIVMSIDNTVPNLTTYFPPTTLSGEGHLTGGHRSFVKPAGHNTWRDDQPITVVEGSGTSSQHVMVIEVSVIV
jgi:hypothetical protein